MTVQEAKKHLENMFPKNQDERRFFEECIDIAIESMKEIEQYRALGTVEELKEAREKQIETDTNVGSKWIPCEERLPSGEEYRKRIDGIWYYQHILTATNDSDIPMQVGWYNQEDECWYDQDGFVFYPIAWQPLPQPFMKEGAE